MTVSTWTAEQDTRLRTLRSDKLSFTDIATLFGMTKGQVAGRCARLGLCTPRPRPPKPYVAACAWPIGDVGAPDFRFCGDVRAPGKPYCVEHTDKATGQRPAGKAAATGLGGFNATSAALLRARRRA